MRRIRVLIVEDSPLEQEMLAYILSADPEMHIVGIVDSGVAALEYLLRERPDVVIMDIHMPYMDGYEATRRIMETAPIPIVMVSASWNPQEVAVTFRAMEAGAVAGVEKPRGVGHPNYEEAAQRLTQTVKAMAEVKVVRRWRRQHLRQGSFLQSVKGERRSTITDIKLVAIGSSTGGPLALQTLLSQLHKDFFVPIVIVQHIASGFLQGLVEWLGHTTGKAVHVAADRERLLPGHIYLAPDGFHTGVERSGAVVLSKEAPEHGTRPSVSYLFRSIATTFGRKAVGVLLTGMGRDGAEELRLLKECGAMTIVQDEHSSVVYGMPGEAVKLGGATYVLPPERIASTLNGIMENMRLQ